MSDVQKAIDFVMGNRAFFAFLAAAAGYIISKVKSAKKDTRIEKQKAALEGVALAVEEFQESLNNREPLAVGDPKGLKKTIAYRVSEGREELDAAIAALEGPAAASGGISSAARAAAKLVLP